MSSVWGKIKEGFKPTHERFGAKKSSNPNLAKLGDTADSVKNKQRVWAEAQRKKKAAELAAKKSN